MRAAGAIGGVLLPELQLTQGEFLLRKGDTERGRAMLLDAVAKLRADPAADTWTLTLLRLEAVCRLSRDLGQWTLAAELAQQMRQYAPTYPGSHYALGKLAEQRGVIVTAQEEYKAAISGWSVADPDLSGLRDARSRLAALKRP
jgi:hypothetical protein